MINRLQSRPNTNQYCRLASIDGEWHEFESKALRKENERKAREARRAEAATAAAAAAGGAPGSSTKDKDRKRAHESRDSTSQRGAKRPHLEGQEPTTAVDKTKEEIQAA